jgi:hypothetical protein
MPRATGAFFEEKRGMSHKMKKFEISTDIFHLEECQAADFDEAVRILTSFDGCPMSCLAHLMGDVLTYAPASGYVRITCVTTGESYDSLNWPKRCQ